MKSAAPARVREVSMSLQDRTEVVSKARRLNEQNCRRELSHSLLNVIARFVTGMGVATLMIVQGG